MLHSIQDLRRFDVRAEDGEVGHIKDVLFDDRDSKIRWLVVDTGGLLRSHPVLLAPEQVARVDSEGRTVEIAADRQTIEDSPPLLEHPPVSRQSEDAIRNYFGLAPVSTTVARAEMAFWGGMQVEQDEPPLLDELEDRAAERADPHLRSAREIVAYRVDGSDEQIGSVDDLIVDTIDAWRISYLVVDTGRWLPGKRRLLGTDMIASISYGDRRIGVELSRAQVGDAADFDATDKIDRSAESRLYRYYGFTPRW